MRVSRAFFDIDFGIIKSVKGGGVLESMVSRAFRLARKREV